MRAILLAAVCVVAMSCAEPKPAPSSAVRHNPASAASAPVVDIEPSAVQPVEQPGFVYCCGNRRFKLEIDCNERLMRCYENRGARWSQTFGRHCKRALGENCYLHACDERCDGR